MWFSPFYAAYLDAWNQAWIESWRQACRLWGLSQEILPQAGAPSSLLPALPLLSGLLSPASLPSWLPQVQVRVEPLPAGSVPGADEAARLSMRLAFPWLGAGENIWVEAVIGRNGEGQALPEALELKRLPGKAS
ncbi:MAG: hypothetical protein KGN39_07715 [Betaproteobacteria bacterium]|nr:hypothetical protein [Betaproteobacteria bacterium]